MNVLFIGLEQINNVSDRGLYTDFLREVIKNGHSLTVISANEKRNRNACKGSYYYEGVHYLFAKTGNITKNSNFLSKGMSIVLAGWQYLFTLKREVQNYDLVICTTPCITFERAMRYAKRRGNGKCVLLLKDLWPYDLLFDNVLTKIGWKGIVYKYLEKISLRLFDASDVIGCMTPKNKQFLESVYNNGMPLDRAIIIPNSIEPLKYCPTKSELIELRIKNNIPIEKTVFVYGGNLGMAQGPEFIIDAIKYSATENEKVFFLIVGNGTDYQRIHNALEQFDNVRCIPALPRNEYEHLVYACDVGLVFLNWNCHSPNVPSRILQYMQAGLPVLCATDDTTDIGEIVCKNGFGLSCQSNSVSDFNNCIKKMMDSEIRGKMGVAARAFIESEYSAHRTYSLIFESYLGEKDEIIRS